MTTLTVVSEKTGDTLGHITLSDGGAVEADGLGQGILDGVKRAKQWDDRKAFEALSTGFSNGYWTVKPAEADAETTE